jgi:hypothetical protein
MNVEIGTEATQFPEKEYIMVFHCSAETFKKLGENVDFT